MAEAIGYLFFAYLWVKMSLFVSKVAFGFSMKAYYSVGLKKVIKHGECIHQNEISGQITERKVGHGGLFGFIGDTLFPIKRTEEYVKGRSYKTKLQIDDIYNGKEYIFIDDSYYVYLSFKDVDKAYNFFKREYLYKNKSYTVYIPDHSRLGDYIFVQGLGNHVVDTTSASLFCNLLFTYIFLPFALVLLLSDFYVIKAVLELINLI